MTKFIVLIFASFLLFTQSKQSVENVELKDLNGQVINSTDLLTNGKSKVFVFWSSYCYYCKLEMKGMTNIGKEWYEDYDAEVIFVSLASYPSDTYSSGKVDFLKDWQGEEGVYFLHDDSMKLYNAFQSQAIPSTVLVDKTGQIHQQWHSYDDGLERSVGMYFKKLANKES